MFALLLSLHLISTNIHADLYGKFPVFAGNSESQHNTPKKYSKYFNKNNIQNTISNECIYTSIGGRTFSGYITIDLNNSGYFADLSGNVISINLETCEQNWNISISKALLDLNQTIIGNETYISKNSPAIFEDINGNKGLLIGAPNDRPNTMNSFVPCFALAISLTGQPMWAIDVSTPFITDPNESIRCVIHAWNIKNKFGYAGMSSLGVTTPGQRFRGRMVKININEQKLEKIWFALPPTNEENDGTYYSGAPMWIMPPVIGNRVLVGTGQLYTVPNRIMKCLNGNFSFIPENNFPFNFCGEKQLSAKYQCFESGVNINSLIVLSKSFDLILSKPTTGIDIFDFLSCFDFTKLVFQGIFDKLKPPPLTCGLDADFTAINSVKFKNRDYAIGQSKTGTLYMLDLKSGDVPFAKKFGVWSRWGGNSYGVAVSEKFDIVIARFTGQNGVKGAFDWNDRIYTVKLSNGNITCATGVVYAIDLKTGKTLYEIANPYGTFTLSECQTLFNDSSDPRLFNENEDVSNEGSCSKNELNNSIGNGNSNNNEVPVIIPEVDSYIKDNLQLSYLRAAFYGPVSIYNKLLFIPSMSGDVFVHDLKTGKHLRTFGCNGEIDDQGVLIRPAIASGVTVVDDRVIFYCGFYTNQRGFEYNGEGGFVKSIRI